jgi:hypothetical protein
MAQRVASAATAWIFQRGLGRLAIAAGLALASGTSAAEGVVTLYGGARGGGDFTDDTTGGSIKLDSGPAVSLSLDWPLGDGRQAQVFYSFQRSALPGSVLNQTGDLTVNINYLHAGGRVFFNGTEDTSAGYVAGGLGITYFSPSLGGLSSELRPSASLGLGYQWMLSKQVSFRAEVRGFLTVVNSEGGFFCSGGCAVSIRGDTMTQVEGLLGLSFGF